MNPVVKALVLWLDGRLTFETWIATLFSVPVTLFVTSKTVEVQVLCVLMCACLSLSFVAVYTSRMRVEQNKLNLIDKLKGLGDIFKNLDKVSKVKEEVHDSSFDGINKENMKLKAEVELLRKVLKDAKKCEEVKVL